MQTMLREEKSFGTYAISAPLKRSLHGEERSLTHTTGTQTWGVSAHAHSGAHPDSCCLCL